MIHLNKIKQFKPIKTVLHETCLYIYIDAVQLLRGLEPVKTFIQESDEQIESVFIVRSELRACELHNIIQLHGCVPFSV